MGYQVYSGEPSRLAAAGFAEFARLSFIYDSESRFQRQANAFLMEFSTGKWAVMRNGVRQQLRAHSRKTSAQYARQLANFLNWLEDKQYSALEVTYPEVLEFQSEVHKGIWSRDGKPLRTNTSNAYTQTACNYLEWLTEKGFRAPLGATYHLVVAPYTNKHTGKKQKAMWVRDRALEPEQRKKRKPDRMPSEHEFNEWLDSIRRQHGDFWHLMVVTCIELALRREELVNLRVDDIPDNEADWDIKNPSEMPSRQVMSIRVKYATKGADKDFSLDDKIGPERDVQLPVSLARKLAAYKLHQRAASLEKWIYGANNLKGKEERRKSAVQLFLHPKTGARITGKQFYDVWTSAPLPLPGWSPHCARDWWACRTILRIWKTVGNAHPGAGAGDIAYVGKAVDSIIEIYVQPQLGHVDPATSAGYCVWLRWVLGSSLHTDYEAALDDFAERLPGGQGKPLT